MTMTMKWWNTRKENQDELGNDWRKFFYEHTPHLNPERCCIHWPLINLVTLLNTHTSHRAVFTCAWLTLLPHLTVTSKEVVLRALKRVLPRLTPAVLVMDWVRSCVNYGETSTITFDGILSASFTSRGAVYWHSMCCSFLWKTAICT